MVIAAKRAKSEKTILKRIRDGISQIQESETDGIVVVDTTLALNPENHRHTALIVESEFALRYLAYLHELVARLAPRIFEMKKGTRALGVIFHDQIIRLDATNSSHLAGMTANFNAEDFNRRRRKLFESFVEQYEKGLPNRQRF